MSMFNGRPDRKSPDAAERTTRADSPFRSNESDLLNSTPDPLSRSTSMPFTPPPAPTPPDKCENVLATGAKWKGTLTVDTSVRVDGNFSGQIESKATVHVADGALVDAKIRAAFVVVSGTFHGEIKCDQRVDLLPHSRVDAEIVTKVLIVEEGAVFDGHIQMTQGDSQRASRSRAGEGETAAERRAERPLTAAPVSANGAHPAEEEAAEA
ncbi:MAG: hypothetical protein GEU75_05530 [Dehalococcoidia bacterium]|nr:hypothetical protein [Dehalococcoidia bacterium]